MKKIILIAFILNFYCLKAQNCYIPSGFDFANAELAKDMKWYRDSISKTKYFLLIELYISEIDTVKRKLEFIFSDSPFTPWSTSNPSHIYIGDTTIFVIRFKKTIDKEIIKKMPFKFIEESDITYIDKEREKYRKLYGYSTGRDRSVVFNIENCTVKCTKYKDPPDEYNIVDLDYSQSHLNYKQYLEKRRVEIYGK